MENVLITVEPRRKVWQKMCCVVFARVSVGVLTSATHGSEHSCGIDWGLCNPKGD